MGDVTRILEAIDEGDTSAAKKLLPFVYDELRRLAAHKLAREKPGQTLQATALVHEAYVRLVGQENPQWENQAHFFHAAAESMRRILVDNARSKHRLKRGGAFQQITLQDAHVAREDRCDDLQALDEALSNLEAVDSRKAALVKLRYFSGLTVEQAAKALGISTTTATEWWAFARAWLHREMRADP